MARETFAEELAKIIDPEAFGLPHPYVGGNWMSDRDEARAKAAIILDLIKAANGKDRDSGAFFVAAL